VDIIGDTSDIDGWETDMSTVSSDFFIVASVIQNYESEGAAPKDLSAWSLSQSAREADPETAPSRARALQEFVLIISSEGPTIDARELGIAATIRK
jgi:hypothetical protein